MPRRDGEQFSRDETDRCDDEEEGFRRVENERALSLRTEMRGDRREGARVGDALSISE